MKTNYLSLGLGLIIILNLLACQKVDLTPRDLNPAPGNGEVSRILLFSSLDTNSTSWIVSEFEYDENGRISKTSSPMYQDGNIAGTISYDLYYYNNDNQLVKKENFNASKNSPTGFINLVNHYYSYSFAGRIIKETLEYPQPGFSETFVYEYRHGLLHTTKFYNNKNQLETYTINHYDASSRLIKEVKYTAEGKEISTTMHSYLGLLCISSDVFQGGTHMREIKRSYNSNNNLLYLESYELVPYSSASSYILKYEYFE